MKQKKAKTKYEHDLFFFAFVFTANQLDPSEKPFYKLGLRVLSGFLKIEYNKALGRCLVLSSVFSCLETLMKQSPSCMNHKFCFREEVDESHHISPFFLH